MKKTVNHFSHFLQRIRNDYIIIVKQLSSNVSKQNDIMKNVVGLLI